MKKVYECVHNGWYCCVEQTGRTDTTEFFAHIHEVMSVNRLRCFESEEDADMLIGNWRVEIGVLIEKVCTSRFGYFTTAEAARQVAIRDAQMRAHVLVVTIKEVGMFLEKFGKQAFLQQ